MFLGDLADLSDRCRAVGGGGLGAFLASERVRELRWPDDVVEQWLYDFAAWEPFLDDYGQVDLGTIQWHEEHLETRTFLTIETGASDAGLLDEIAEQADHWSEVRRHQGVPQYWSSHGTWLRRPLLLERGLLVAHESGLQVIEGRTRVGVLRGFVRAGRDVAPRQLLGWVVNAMRYQQRRRLLASRKNRTKSKQQPQVRRSSGKPGAKAPKKARDAMTAAELYADLRQGARNVAGVSWQTIVTVDLLVQSRAGDLPFVRITPEGFEDADCRHADGASTRVQMKESEAGSGTLAAAAVADALTHASVGTSNEFIALITDAHLGSGLTFTGWTSVIADQGGQPIADVKSALRTRGVTDTAADDLLSRSRLIQSPWALRSTTELRLADASGAHPTVASFAVGHLYEAVSQAAAANRESTLTTQHALDVQDVDAAIATIQNAVDLHGLRIAEIEGICQVPDFLTPSSIQSQTFYLGVDGAPSHIAAGLDVQRENLLTSIRAGLAKERAVIALGPSGSGKSTLLWRAARDGLPGSRALRVLRVRTSHDADLLVRHVQLMRPSPSSPVVVVADNLGRPAMATWTIAASRLRELDAVVLLCAARAEDFTPHLVHGPTALVNLELDHDSAIAIAEVVARSGIELHMAPAEAHARSAGLLMEFLALLTQGRRLVDVLAAQAEDLRATGRELDRLAARILTAAHSVGLSVNADSLGAALVDSGTPTEVGDALARLENEHIVIRDGLNYTGLHELRSATLADLLHRRPPPSLSATWASVARILAPEDCGWLLRRVAERDPGSMASVANAVGLVAAATTTNTRQVAELLEGAERADNAIYAAKCLPTLESERPPVLSVHQTALFAYGVRNQGMTIDLDGFEEVRRLAFLLPERSAEVAQAVAGHLADDVLKRLLTTGSLSDCTRLIEAASGLVTLSNPTAKAVAERFPQPANLDEADLWARLVEGILRGVVGGGTTESVFGDEDQRAQTIGRVDPDALSVSWDGVSSLASITRMLSLDPLPGRPLDWDFVARSGSKDIVNDVAVGAARRLAAAVPEAIKVEVITVTPNATRYRVGEIEPGYKHMTVAEAMPDRVSVRRSVGFQAALKRLTASHSWSSYVRAQSQVAVELLTLLFDAPSRLRTYDNAGRRQQWSARLETTATQLALLQSRPTSVAVPAQLAHAAVDDLERAEDAVTTALANLATALAQVPGGRDKATAMSLRDCLAELNKAADANEPAFASLESVIDDEVLAQTQRLADLLAALAQYPDLRPRLSSGNLTDACDEIISSAASVSLEAQRARLAAELAAVPSFTLLPFEDREAPPWALNCTSWVISVSLDHWEDLVAILATLTLDVREELNCRVIAIPVVDDGSALAAGVLMSYMRQGTLQLLPDDARAIAEAAGMATTPSSGRSEELLTVFRQLVLASAQAARWRRRSPELGPINQVSRQSVSAIGELGAAALEQFPSDEREDFASALDFIVEWVVRETESTYTGNTLAGLVMQLPDEWDESDDLTLAVHTLGLAALLD